MKIDHQTVEKGLLSTVVALQQAYMMGMRVSEKDAKTKTMNFLSEKVVPLLGQESSGTKAKSIIKQAVDGLIEEYNSKQDKAFLCLLRLRDMLT